jgi:hypothetical protein
MAADFSPSTMSSVDRVNRRDVIPGDVGGPIVTEANLATGHIRFYASNSATTGFLEGTGVVMRI